MKGVRASEQNPSTPERRLGNWLPAVQHQNSENTTLRLDLRGMSVNDALGETDYCLNKVLLAGFSEVEIIHGPGNRRIAAACSP